MVPTTGVGPIHRRAVNGWDQRDGVKRELENLKRYHPLSTEEVGWMQEGWGGGAGVVGVQVPCFENHDISERSHLLIISVNYMSLSNSGILCNTSV